MQDLTNQPKTWNVIERAKAPCPLQPHFPPAPRVNHHPKFIITYISINCMLYIIHNIYLRNLSTFLDPPLLHILLLIYIYIYIYILKENVVLIAQWFYTSLLVPMCSRFSKPWRYIPSSGIVRPLGSVSSTFLSYCQIVLQKGCVNSHSHYQCIIVSFSLHALHTFKCLSILWTWKEILLYLSISLIFNEATFSSIFVIGACSYIDYLLKSFSS